MHTIRFGRRLSLPSTIAIKHQLRKAMAADQVKKAGAEARAELTDTPQINVGRDRRSGIWNPYGNLEGSEGRPDEAGRVPLVCRA
jgi:hypothetical protein